MIQVTVRVYGPLNDFVPAHRRRVPWPHVVDGHSSVKDLDDLLREVAKSAVDAALLPRTRQHYDHFEMCSGCGRVYWKGSHWERLKRAIEAAREEAERRAM